MEFMDLSKNVIECPKCKGKEITFIESHLSHVKEKIFEYDQKEGVFVAVNMRYVEYEPSEDDFYYGYECKNCGVKSDEIGTFIVGHRFHDLELY